jgi:hypothetical protein
LARGVAGSPANQGRRDRARQQDRQNAWAMMVKGERYKEPAALAA